MKSIANLLQVNLNENFKIIDSNSEVRGIGCLTSEGLLIRLPDITGYSNQDLVDILTGVYSIEQLPYEPQIGDMVYSVNADGEVVCLRYSNSFFDVTMHRLGNCYRTHKEAEDNSKHWKDWYANKSELTEISEKSTVVGLKE